MLASFIKQSDSAIHICINIYTHTHTYNTHIYTLSQILFYYRLLQDLEYISMCHALNSFCLPVIYIYIYIYVYIYINTHTHIYSGLYFLIPYS